MKVNRIWSIVLLSSALVAVTGCTAASGDVAEDTSETTASSEATTASRTPSPTPTPSATPSLTREEQVFAEAVQAAKQYIALATDIENRGGQDWEDLKPWWGNDEMLAGGTEYYRRFLDNGVSTIGYSVVRDARVVSVQLDAYGDGLDQAEFTFCLDGEHDERRDAEGKPIPNSGSTNNVTMVMRRTASGNHWTIDWMDSAAEPPC